MAGYSILDAEVPFDARVLVCVVTRPADLERVRAEGWYRIPMARAPRLLAAEYLAFYLTAAFGAERWSVRYYAPVQSITIATRAGLLPSEAGHRRAMDRYYRFALGPLGVLPAPVPSRRLRRITFIPTRFGQLLYARDVVDLWEANGAIGGDADVWGAGVNG